MAVPTYTGETILDGAWVLLRVRRVAQYPLERDWFKPFRKWISDIAGLVDDVRNGVSSREEAVAALRPGTAGPPTAYDTYRTLRDRILNDGALTQTEAAAYAMTLSEHRRLAMASMQSGDASQFPAGVQALRGGLLEGRTPSPATRATLNHEFAAAAAVRPALADSRLAGEAVLARQHASDDPFAALRDLSRLTEVLPER